MRTMRRRRQCWIESARFFVSSILLLSFFAQTQQQQRDISGKWDNRLLPTNSVYEKSREFAAPLANLENSRILENSSSNENASNEELYYDDYENDDPNENIDKSIEKSPTVESIEDHKKRENDRAGSEKKLGLESTRETLINHDDPATYYYYYDDYENITNPENGDSERDLVDFFDSSEVATHPSTSEIPKNLSTPLMEEKSKIAESSMEEKLKMHDTPTDEMTKMTETKEISSTEEMTKTEEKLPNTAESSKDERSKEADSLADEISKMAESSIEEVSVNSTLESSHEFLNEEEEKEEEEIEKSEEKSPRDEKSGHDDEILIGEAVVSVVTTKSVVNGTISVPVSPRPMTTEQIVSSIIQTSTENPGLHVSNVMFEESTEDSRIVASVQTSRSISGARFLPFLVVDSDEMAKKKPENTTKKDEKSMEMSMNEEESRLDDETKDGALSTAKKSSIPVESTESIIDKLDRVQSELSSGFLANGLRTPGNTLQLDVLSEQRPPQNRKTFTTTSRTPIISKFVPRRYGQDKKISTTTPAPLPRVTETVVEDDATGSTEKIKFRWPSSSRNSRPSVPEADSSSGNKNHNIRDFISNVLKKSTTTPSTSGAVEPDISAFLPPGYKLKKEEVTEKSLIGEILAKSKFDISSLLPTNYQGTEKSTKINEKGEKNLSDQIFKPNLDFSSLLPAGYRPENVESGEATRTTDKSAKGEKSLTDLFSKPNVDIAALLPPGYNGFKDSEKSTSLEKETSGETLPTSLATTPKTLGGIKLVFPSRPGGRKALSKSTTQSSRNEGGGPVTPRIQKGWPTRATTEFTGWPTPSTTPISIERLLEAARTATIASTNVSSVKTTETPTTTSTSTTTTTTPRPTTPGICEDECEVAGTIRIVGNATWVPELLDRNTQEWQLLAEEIEKEMNLVFVKSSVLRKWYKRVRIDAFSPGSILVDYFIELIDIPQRINTQELKVIFHDSLRTYNSEKWNETRAKGPIRLGTFAIDPKSTDFVVVPKVSYPQHIEADDRLIPQWAIAVIVIGVGGLLFIIVFGVSVLVNRQNAAKLKPGPVVYTEEVAKNIIQASHGAPSHRSSQDYPKSEISTIWNDTDVWRDKSFESNSNEILVDGGTLGRTRNPERRGAERKYNMYDSWRSEWNGYYYNPSQSSKFAGYESTTNLSSRHPPDYDTNF